MPSTPKCSKLKNEEIPDNNNNNNKSLENIKIIPILKNIKEDEKQKIFIKKDFTEEEQIYGKKAKLPTGT